MLGKSNKKVLNRTIESRALIAAAVSAVVVFLLGIFIYVGTSTPLFGQNSVGLTSAIFVALSVAVSFLYSLYTLHPRVKELRKVRASRSGHIKRWIKLLAITFVFSSLGFLLCSIVFFVAQQAFLGVQFDMWASSVVTAASAAVGSYVSFLVAASLTPMTLASSLALFLASGVLTSAISVSDPYWWQYHFSSLGAGATASSAAFNITLVITGIVIWVLAGLLSDDLKVLQSIKRKVYPRRNLVFQIILILLGAALAMVGLFVYNEFPKIHNSAAGAMAVLFLGVVAALPYILPSQSKTFYLYSYAMLGVLGVCVFLFYGLQYFNLTTFELSAAAVIFCWIIVLVRHISASLIDVGDPVLHLEK